MTTPASGGLNLTSPDAGEPATTFYPFHRLHKEHAMTTNTETTETDYDAAEEVALADIHRLNAALDDAPDMATLQDLGAQFIAARDALASIQTERASHEKAAEAEALKAQRAAYAQEAIQRIESRYTGPGRAEVLELYRPGIGTRRSERVSRHDTEAFMAAVLDSDFRASSFRVTRSCPCGAEMVDVVAATPAGEPSNPGRTLDRTYHSRECKETFSVVQRDLGASFMTKTQDVPRAELETREALLGAVVDVYKAVGQVADVQRATVETVESLALRLAILEADKEWMEPLLRKLATKVEGLEVELSAAKRASRRPRSAVRTTDLRRRPMRRRPGLG